MKKICSIIIVLILLFAMTSICVNAADAAQTNVDVSEGDKLTYSLTLSDVPERVVGCDFSIYYDSSVLSCNSFTDEPDSAVVNKDLDGEVRGNWSVLKGEDFSSARNVITVDLSAKSSGDTHISYYIRYLYPDSLVQFTQYTFTCSLSKNGSSVYEDAEPELNQTAKQTSGEFVNSVTGKSSDASVNTYKNGNSSNPNSGDKSVEAKENESVTNKNNNNKNNSKTVQTDKSGNVISEEGATPSSTENNANGGGPSVYLIIILSLIAIAIIALIVYFIIRAKKVKPIE